MRSRRLERSTRDRVISGVCGGLAEYLAVDATVVRAFFVIATVITAFLFLLVYLVLLILMPLPGQRAPIDDLWPGARTGGPSVPSAAPGEATGAMEEVTPPPADPAESRRRRDMFGWALVVIGGIFLLSNAGALEFIRWSVAWPLVLIALGVLFLVQRGRS
jgi:phage shock protein PspC (stress-responsive transcriptional regulator)